ncbi:MULTISPECIES: hypothetical protein [unclassified Rhizobium]|uniref:hypothetical protein n=1 Tax=unclassified Rhizobium TaxID=2613769 RepID=UPI00288C5693|nr:MULTISPECIES: hypothetical protein [unclassified Rhizobium]
MKEFYDAAEQFRDLIITTPKNSLPVTLHNFPNGSCGDASLLLGHHLTELGLGEFRYYLGWRDGSSHAWLRSGSVIIDVTASQFDDFGDPVFVSDQSSWHESFAGSDKHAANLTVFGEPTTSMLRHAYAAILDSASSDSPKI